VPLFDRPFSVSLSQSPGHVPLFSETKKTLTYARVLGIPPPTTVASDSRKKLGSSRSSRDLPNLAEGRGPPASYCRPRCDRWRRNGRKQCCKKLSTHDYLCSTEVGKPVWDRRDLAVLLQPPLRSGSCFPLQSWPWPVYLRSTLVQKEWMINHKKLEQYYRYIPVKRKDKSIFWTSELFLSFMFRFLLWTSGIIANSWEKSDPTRKSRGTSVWTKPNVKIELLIKRERKEKRSVPKHGSAESVSSYTSWICWGLESCICLFTQRLKRNPKRIDHR
jgi:hypothetical protein